jgi:hypothetical protein
MVSLVSGFLTFLFLGHFSFFLLSYMIQRDSHQNSSVPPLTANQPPTPMSQFTFVEELICHLIESLFRKQQIMGHWLGEPLYRASNNRPSRTAAQELCSYVRSKKTDPYQFEQPLGFTGHF